MAGDPGAEDLPVNSPGQAGKEKQVVAEKEQALKRSGRHRKRRPLYPQGPPNPAAFLRLVQ
jgi:hypothetical protein